MARAKKFRWGAIGLAILVAIAGVGLWVMPTRQTSSAQDAPKAAPPLIARGYTDAPEGTAVVAGDPAGGSVLVELQASRTARRSRRARSSRSCPTMPGPT